MNNDGPKPRETELEKAEREVAAEEQRWREENIPHPSGSFSTDIFALYCEHHLMKEILVERGLITQDELNVRRMKVILEMMTTMRESIVEQRRNSIVARVMPPTLPDGKPPFER